MKIVKPSAKLIDNINTAEIYAKIERCGRVCYQSEPKGDPENFIRMLIKRGHESVLEHVSLTFNIICDRAIMAELTRHRLASFSVESTRYVKYDELEVIRPHLQSIKPFGMKNAKTYEEAIAYDAGFFVLTNLAWEANIRKFEDLYKTLLTVGDVKPEQARAVLPLCLKSELYMTANLREWRHILKLRTSPKAHPEMRLVAGQILSTFKEKMPVIVEDIS